MASDPPQATNRILVVDDNDDIHRLMRNVLLPEPRARDNRLEELSAALFEESDAPSHASDQPPEVTVDSAFQGEEAIRMVREAAREGAPYLLAFVDIRMPPGMDGIHTVKALWEDHPDLYVVVCSAYSDYTWQSLSKEIGYSPNVLILRKPFDPIEVRQIVASISKMYRVIARVKSALADYQHLVDAYERKASTREAALRALTRASSDAVLYVSRVGVIEEANTAAERLLGATGKSLTGTELQVLLGKGIAPDWGNAPAKKRVRAHTAAGTELQLNVTIISVEDEPSEGGEEGAFLCLCSPS